jgi:hypothetical protein
MRIVDLLFLLFAPATYLTLLACGRVWPGCEFPPRRGWQWPDYPVQRPVGSTPAFADLHAAPYGPGSRDARPAAGRLAR